MNDQITAQEWFSTGARVIYDPVTKKVRERAQKADIASESMCGNGLSVMPPGGHMITSEQPEQLARIIEEVGPSMATG